MVVVPVFSSVRRSIGAAEDVSTLGGLLGLVFQDDGLDKGVNGPIFLVVSVAAAVGMLRSRSTSPASLDV
ncbi:hypothetical protein VTK73DRAFT_9114 [Phialemonium thermophilum]|uniref:Uncharacterized protein n=1 Tax=Phialemonium thermophilum TaxID=223376 RepID=A0ABR3W4I5_9PEZI